MENLNHKIYELLTGVGVPENLALFLNLLGLLIVVAIAWYLLHLVTHRILHSTLSRLADRTRGDFDNYLVEYRSITFVARLLPLIIWTQLVPWIFVDYPQYQGVVLLLTDIYMILLVVWIAKSVLFAGRDYLKAKDSFKDKPMESFAQVIMIVVYFTAFLVIFSRITGRSVVAFLTAMGAASAVLLLIFKDTILGFVASIQVSANDMVRIGDWITIDKYGADGDVVEINLTTVKVQNFDKTITTIPTYALISDSFKNWRSMQAEGARRMKRPITVKISSIRYLTENDLKELAKIELIKDYVTSQSHDIAQYNKEKQVDKSVLINGRNLTNVGVFRIYMKKYLEQHPQVHKGLIMMVRQLEPTDHGMPIELYAFANDARWVYYESIMADIFDHLLAAVRYFDLEIFELPSSSDIHFLGQKASISSVEKDAGRESINYQKAN